MTQFSIYPISERAVTLEFGNAIDLATHNKVMQYYAAIQSARMPGFIECVPAYTTLTLYFDLKKIDQSELEGENAFQKVKNFIWTLKINSDTNGFTDKLIEIPVCYEETFGIDLSELAMKNNLSIQDIVKLHSEIEYTVFMIGFAPGFPYMGEIDERLVCARRANPRKKVPAGSVAIAGRQTGIYPFDTPGGWQIIGRTPVDLFSITRNPASLLQAGMRVKFSPITLTEFEKLNRA